MGSVETPVSQLHDSLLADALSRRGRVKGGVPANRAIQAKNAAAAIADPPPPTPEPPFEVEPTSNLEPPPGARPSVLPETSRVAVSDAGVGTVPPPEFYPPKYAAAFEGSFVELGEHSIGSIEGYTMRQLDASEATGPMLPLLKGTMPKAFEQRLFFDLAVPAKAVGLDPKVKVPRLNQIDTLGEAELRAALNDLGDRVPDGVGAVKDLRARLRVAHPSARIAIVPMIEAGQPSSCERKAMCDRSAAPARCEPPAHSPRSLLQDRSRVPAPAERVVQARRAQADGGGHHRPRRLPEIEPRCSR